MAWERGNQYETLYEQHMLAIRFGREFHAEPASAQDDNEPDDEEETLPDPDPEFIEVDWTEEFLTIARWLGGVCRETNPPRTLPIDQPDVPRLFDAFSEYPEITELSPWLELAPIQDGESTLDDVPVMEDVGVVEEVQVVAESVQQQKMDDSSGRAVLRGLFDIFSEYGD
jgi:hypothetical protein